LLGTNGVPCAPILNVAEAFAHPQVQAVGIIQSAPGVDMPVVSAAWTMDGIRPEIRSPAPVLGEGNDTILGQSTSSDTE
jgi:crotonobetainyl-CoA:carnitine CoA-transferase CaiB-like acyl-CoA transferase